MPTAANGQRGAVVIPCLNAANTITTALRVLNEQTVRDRLRIIVIDNGSTDGSLELAAEAADEVHIEPRRGSFAARNLGLSMTRERFLLSLDADCWPCTDRWAELHLAALEAAPTGVVGTAGPLYPAPSSDWWANRADVTPAPAFSAGKPLYAVGGNRCMATEALRALGGFPPYHADDSALGRLMQNAGQQFAWVPEAAVYHANPSGPRGYFRQMRKVGMYASEPALLTPTPRSLVMTVGAGSWRIAKETIKGGPREGFATALKVVALQAGYRDLCRTSYTSP